MQAQTLTTVPIQANTYDIVSSLSSRQDNAHVMKAPYTVLIKKITNNYYLWIVYSWPRPYNAIWGDVVVSDNTTGTDIRVEYGCSWKDNLSIVVDILKYRRRDGFTVVSTLSKDKVNSRILGSLIRVAYENGADVQYGNIMGGSTEMLFISNRDINDQILNKMYDQSEFDETDQVVERISQEIAGDHLTDPNLSQYVANSSGIPKNIIDKIHDFLEHSTATNEDINIKCKSYITCKDESINGTNDRDCDLYRHNWSSLSDEGDLR